MKYVTSRHIFYLILGITLTTIGLLFGLDTFEQAVGLIVGFIITLVTLLMHMMGNVTSILHIITYSINSISIGFSISSIYTYLEAIPSTGDVILTAIIALVVGLASILLFKVVRFQSLEITTFVLFTVFLLFATIAQWLSTNELLHSIMIFYAIILIFYAISYILEPQDLEQYRTHKSIISFSLYIVVTVIALVIISEGDVLQGLDGFGSIGPRKKKETH